MLLNRWILDCQESNLVFASTEQAVPVETLAFDSAAAAASRPFVELSMVVPR